jgi:hypothetical protein
MSKKIFLSPIYFFISVYKIKKYYNKKESTLRLFDFDKPIYWLPSGIKILIFDCMCGHDFNFPLGKLPDTITEISFPDSFNNSIKSMSLNITALHFGHSHNQPIEKLLGHLEKLTHLTFGSSFVQSINNLPNCITHLTIGFYFNQKVYSLPKNLKGIKVNSNSFNFNDVKEFPSGLNYLEINSDSIMINNIPEHIETLRINFVKAPIQAFNFHLNIKKIYLYNYSIRECPLPKVPFGCKIVELPVYLH